MVVSLSDSLRADNEYFKYMLGLLPPQLTSAKDKYGEDDSQDDSEAEGSQAEGSEAEGSEADDSDEEKQAKRVEDSADVEMASEAEDENEDLQTKLQRKLAELKAKRCKPGAADKSEEHRLKRKLSKAKLKKRRATEKKTAALAVAGATKLSTNSISSTAPPAKPIFNKEGKMVFSKFDFHENGDKIKGISLAPRKKTDQPTGKNYKNLIEKVTRQKTKLETLEKVDKQKATQLKEKIAWKAAISKAEGIKVKDNVDLLKKALKKKEQRSEKSKKDWKKREAMVEKKKKGVQEKREANISKRRNSKKEKSEKRSKKRGHLIKF